MTHVTSLLYKIKLVTSEASPTIVSCNASAVKIYNAASSPARFVNKNVCFYFVKRSSLIQRCRCSCKFRNRLEGLALDFKKWKMILQI
jgi:hypothetical protein